MGARRRPKSQYSTKYNRKIYRCAECNSTNTEYRVFSGKVLCLDCGVIAPDYQCNEVAEQFEEIDDYILRPEFYANEQN